MSEKSRKLHQRTAGTVFSGLVVNYPLQLFILWVLIDIYGVSSAFLLGTYTTLLMTLFAYTRVYLVLRFFDSKEYSRDTKE